MLVNKLLLVASITTSIYATNYASLLFHGNCVTCHHETKAISAPSALEIQKAYKSAFSKKELC